MSKYEPFIPCQDATGQRVPAISQRRGRFYGQVEVPGAGPRKLPLLDEAGAPVTTLEAARASHSRLLANKAVQQAASQQSPRFRAYVGRYIGWLQQTNAKSLLTIKKEKSALKGWSRFLKAAHIAQVSVKDIRDYALFRSTEDKVSNRAINLDVVALSNLFRFAKEEGVLKGDLPTDSWIPLKYTAPTRPLLSLTQIESLVTEALSQVNGEQKYENGRLFADLIQFIAFSGARRQAALSARWENVDWTNRQLTLFTKFDKRVVVDFNSKLAALLGDMASRDFSRSPWLFPGAASGHFVNPSKMTEKISAACGIPEFTLHDLRHFFISYCVMSGIDTLTVASWIGHSDGGVLIGKVYGHLDPKHKRDSASKLRFES